jgi:hypothetical protein
MSQVDNGLSPAYIPPGTMLQFGGDAFAYFEGNQTAQAILAAVTLSANTTVAALNNAGCRGAIFVVNVTALPGSASTTVALKLFVTAAGITADLVSRTPISATGPSVFMVYPGLSASIGGVSCVIPRNFGVRLSLSTGATSKECSLSMTMMRID